MDIQQIVDTIKKVPITPEEQEMFLKELDKEMLSIKDKEPEKYLQFLKTLNEIFAEINQVFRNPS